MKYIKKQKRKRREIGMEKEEIKAIIESILFAAGKDGNNTDISMALEKPKEEIENIINLENKRT